MRQGLSAGRPHLSGTTRDKFRRSGWLCRSGWLGPVRTGAGARGRCAALVLLLLYALPGGGAGCEPAPDMLANDQELADQGNGGSGSPDLGALYVDGCPVDMVLQRSGDQLFCIDRYEAALVQLGVSGTVPWPSDRPPDGVDVRAVVAVGIKPQGYISQVQAQKACQRAGKRLCKESEWEFACRGAANTTYPYGQTYKKGACNEGRPRNPVNDCFGDGPGVFTYENMNDPCCVKWPDTVAKGGAFGECKTPLGVFDLHGNLHEWVDTVTLSGNGVFRGGFFVDAKINGAGCGYRTTAHRPSYHDYSTGFRCCADPPR